MSTDQTPYEIFLSYSRQDNALPPHALPDAKGWVSALRDHILEDHRRFSTEPLRIFFDVSEIRDMDDWQHRILGALRRSKILLVCLSPDYFRSQYCRWEWDEYLRRQVHQLMGADSIATVYFVEVPGSGEQDNARWLASVTHGNFTDIRPWFPEGAAALQREEVRRRMAVLGQSLWERIQRARRAEGVPGNLRRQNPFFVGRREELRRLHEQLATGAVGLVTAVHGLGGQGKTELAVAYAHGWADSYPAGLWVLGAEGKKELLPLIGELAHAPELGYRPTDAERTDPALLGRAVLAELQRRAQAVRAKNPDSATAALLILDNVSEAALLSGAQLATLPRADWLRIIATTRLDAAGLDPSGKSLAHIAVDSLAEEDALALLRDHQLEQQFASAAEEAAAREIVRELGGFTLAVEQVAVHLGLHPELAPAAFLAGLRAKGLPRVDLLGQRDDVQAQMLHQQKQLAVILEATLALLDAPARTALQFAALLPPDSVPWPWLKALTSARHPELAQSAPDEPDPWVATRRRLEGLRLLTPGDHPELARLHRLVAAHLQAGCAAVPSANPSLTTEIEEHLAARALEIYRAEMLPELWEMDVVLATLPGFIARPEVSRDLVNATVFLSDKVLAYRSLMEAHNALRPAHEYLQRTASADPSNAGWQRYLSVSHDQMGDVLRAQGDLAGALVAHREALALSQRLASADPSNAGWQHDLAASHDRMGDVLSAQGDLAGALVAYREALAVSQRLASADPSNADWQYDLYASHQRIGTVLRAQGDLAGALQAHRESLVISQPLALADPSHAGWQRGLSLSHINVGDGLLALGDLAGALKHAHAAHDIAASLRARFPENPEFQLLVFQAKVTLFRTQISRLSIRLAVTGAIGALAFGGWKLVQFSPWFWFLSPPMLLLAMFLLALLGARGDRTPLTLIAKSRFMWRNERRMQAAFKRTLKVGGE